MLCFRVAINGSHRCVAGVKEGVLTAILNGPDRISFHVGGLESDQHVTWLESFGELTIGDQVLVDIIDGQPDLPAERRASEPAWSRHAVPLRCLEGAIIGFLAVAAAQYSQSLGLNPLLIGAIVGTLVLPLISFVAGNLWWRSKIAYGARKRKSRGRSTA